jgi:Tol biopolymer transport system component
MGAAATPVTPAVAPLTMSSTSIGSIIARPLTGSGDNSDGRFSPDGTRVVFVSRFRPHHKQAQVYELHLGRMTEKRITYHDGDDAGPIYSADGLRLIFSSTTDEIKSPGYAVQRMMKTYVPAPTDKAAQVKESRPLPSTEAGFELYEQTLHGRTIERLSQSPGFDGDADIELKGKRVVFSSDRSGGGTNLFLQPFTSSKSVIRLTEGRVIDRGARFSADSSALVWSRQALGGDGLPSKESRLLFASGSFRKFKVLFEAKALNLQPAWHPHGTEVVFSSNLAGNHFNLFAIDLAGKCLRRLSTADVDQMQPAFSPDGKRVLFTVNNKSQQQIFIMDYAPPAECWQLGVDSST